jgi:hypothetical protein
VNGSSFYDQGGLNSLTPLSTVETSINEPPSSTAVPLGNANAQASNTTVSSATSGADNDLSEVTLKAPIVGRLLELTQQGFHGITYDQDLQAYLAVQPTINDYVQHYLDGTAQTVYRLGTDVNLSDYAAGQFDEPVGSQIPIAPNKTSLGAAALNYSPILAPIAAFEAETGLQPVAIAPMSGSLPAGALSDTFIYGSIAPVTILGDGQVQLGSDTFNFDNKPERDEARNFETLTQKILVAGNQTGKNFDTVFLGPTKAPSPPGPYIPVF